MAIVGMLFDRGLGRFSLFAGCLQLVSGRFMSFQVVSGRFKSFQVVSARFTFYQLRVCITVSVSSIKSSFLIYWQGNSSVN